MPIEVMRLGQGQAGISESSAQESLLRIADRPWRKIMSRRSGSASDPLRIEVEDARWNSSNAHLFYQVLGEGNVAVKPKWGVIYHDEVGTLRLIHLEAYALESVHQDVLLGPVILNQLLVVSVGSIEGCHCAILQRGRCGEGEEGVSLAQAPCQVRRSHSPTNLPACKREGLPQGIHGHRSFVHTFDGCQRDVLSLEH